jgi:Antibiotic biosynthesis monooxygenase
MPEFYDVVRAKARNGADEELVRRLPALHAGVREKLPGLLDITLLRLDDGSYIHVLRWESRDAADAAIPRFGEVPEAGAIHDLLSGGELGMYRGEVVADR